MCSWITVPVYDLIPLISLVLLSDHEFVMMILISEVF